MARRRRQVKPIAREPVAAETLQLVVEDETYVGVGGPSALTRVTITARRDRAVKLVEQLDAMRADGLRILRESQARYRRGDPI